MAAILEASIPQPERPEKDGDGKDDGDPPNGGTLVLDATCCPADIAYPQDVNLLNQAREKLEQTVDEICESTGQKKPRMYRQCARRDFLRLSRSKKRSAKAIRSAVKKQLQYIRRDVGYIVQFVQNGVKLTAKQKNCMNLVTTVYEQQRLMFEDGTHSIPRRIVNLAQPWVRPIVRGKAHANTEFGAKLHISLVDGYARIERLDFEPFNESEDLWKAVFRYRDRYGRWPQRILADKIYRTRQTLAFCKEHGIRLSGPAWDWQARLRPGPYFGTLGANLPLCHRRGPADVEPDEEAALFPAPFFASTASLCACGLDGIIPDLDGCGVGST